MKRSDPPRPTFARARLRARDPRELELVVNLIKGRETMRRTRNQAVEEGNLPAARSFNTKMRKREVGLTRIADGEDIEDVYEWVTGSRPFARRTA